MNNEHEWRAPELDILLSIIIPADVIAACERNPCGTSAAYYAPPPRSAGHSPGLEDADNDA